MNVKLTNAFVAQSVAGIVVRAVVVVQALDLVAAESQFVGISQMSCRARAHRSVFVHAAESVGAAKCAATRVSALQKAGVTNASQVLRAGLVGFALVGSLAARSNKRISDSASRADALVRARNVVALGSWVARSLAALVDIEAASGTGGEAVSASAGVIEANLCRVAISISFATQLAHSVNANLSSQAVAVSVAHLVAHATGATFSKGAARVFRARQHARSTLAAVSLGTLG